MSKNYGTICFLAISIVLFLFSPSHAQVFRFSLGGYGISTSGDLTKKEFKNSSAGYVNFATGGNFEFKYYTNSHLGLGVRWTYAEYERDKDAYQADLKNYLGIVDDQYYMRDSYPYIASNFHLGLSYLYDLSNKFQLEPYFYFGFTIFASPLEQATYAKDGFTHNYRKYATGFAGFSYSPGVKLQWNIAKHFGLHLFAEYEGASLGQEIEKSIIYSYNTFEKNKVNKKYRLQQVNIGLGLNVSIGKGL